MEVNNKKFDVSVILPCRNEELALGQCLSDIKKVFELNNIDGEIIVSDSSTDRSPEIAREHGVELVIHHKDGYGNAYLEGFKTAHGKYFFMADADGTYDFNEIPKFIKALDEGADFVIGNRFGGNMENGSMPWLHRLVGNPLLSSLLRLFFQSNVRDVHCGMRAVKKEVLEKMNLHATGMEFASEMVIKAAKNKMRVIQLPINYHLRKGKSKLKPLADGWRHLRFMLLFSPLFLFFIPGLTLFLIGAVLFLLLYFHQLVINGVSFQYHPMFLASLLIIAGYQLMIFSFFSKTYAITHFGETSKIIDWLNKKITIEKASILGLVVIVIGSLVYLNIFIGWVINGFGELREVENSILAMVFMMLGIQTIFSSFMLSILGVKSR